MKQTTEGNRMSKIVRLKSEKATHGKNIWGVPTPEATMWFRRRWAAKYYLAGLAVDDEPQTLADLKSYDMLIVA
jgi:hypothetical protein